MFAIEAGSGQDVDSQGGAAVPSVRDRFEMSEGIAEMKLKLRWLWKDLTSQLWFTVAMYCLLGVGTALSALVLDPLIPSDVSSSIGADAVD